MAFELAVLAAISIASGILTGFFALDFFGLKFGWVEYTFAASGAAAVHAFIFPTHYIGMKEILGALKN